MIEAQLFIGVELDANLSDCLENANPKLVSLLIQQDSNYLQKLSYHERHYLGKFVGKMGNLPQLELLELNIRSLLKKLGPHLTPQQIQIVLIPYLETQQALIDSKYY